VNRATRLAWIPLGLALVSIAPSVVVLADSSPSPTSPSPTPTTTPPATVSLSTSSGPVGALVAVAGSRFPPSTGVAVYLDTSDQGYVASPARLNDGVGLQTDPQGSFSQAIVIPSAQFGSHGICADTGYGPPGTQFSLKGTGFPAGQVVRIYLDSEALGLFGGGEGGMFFNDRYTDGQGDSSSRSFGQRSGSLTKATHWLAGHTTSVVRFLALSRTG
jgi:hypothetical protein